MDPASGRRNWISAHRFIGYDASMNSPADVRSKVRKIGPRALTFCATPDAEGVLLVNCPGCDAFTSENGLVRQACGSEFEAGPLVTGWYRAVTNCAVYIQQLNPDDACDADPLNCGIPLNPGEAFEFYVDLSCVDGIIAVFFCPASDLTQCPPQCICTPSDCTCFVAINRIDTILPMEATGDTFSPGSPGGSSACGTPPGPATP